MDPEAGCPCPRPTHDIGRSGQRVGRWSARKWQKVGPAAYRHRPHLSLARPRGRRPFRSQPYPLSQEPESPGTAVVVEVGLGTVTLIVEGLMVIASLVEATLIPLPLVKLWTALTRSTVTAWALLVKLCGRTALTRPAVSTVTAWVLLAALAEGCSARRRIMSRVGGRRADAGSQPGETDAKGNRRCSSQMSCAHYQLFLETGLLAGAYQPAI